MILVKLGMVNMGMMMVMVVIMMEMVMGMMMEMMAGMVTVMVRCRKPPTLESQTEETSLLPTRDLFDELQLGF